MSSTSKSPKIYITACLEVLQELAASSLPEGSFVELQSKYSPQNSGPNKFECPALEDDDLASKIELLYADIPVIARYRHKLTALKWAHTGWNGVDYLINSLDPNEPFPSFQLTKTLGIVNADLITEFVLGYIIALERKYFTATQFQSRREWNMMELAAPGTLSTVIIGILGVGAVGKHLAKRCKLFGMKVWGMTRRPPTPETASPDVDVYKTLEDLPKLLENCDYICNLLPSTPQTINLLSGDVLSNCKQKKCVFINVARGDVIDEESIVKAIKNGWLSGAVLDVFVKEPMPPESPVWDLPGVIITPHVSGWSKDESHAKRVNECFIRNYRHYMAGEPLEGVLNWEQGY